MRVIQTKNPKEIRKIMQDIKVDPYGIRIMLPKAVDYLVRINSLSSIAANILKQEMLSVGADVAIARDTLTGRLKKTDCLLMGNLAQFNRLSTKLNKQPFGLSKLGQGLSCLLANYQKNNFILRLGKYSLNITNRPYLMGILNLTPDSFSADGLYRKSQIANRKSQVDGIIEYAQGLVADGADILDLGGESTRPGARPVPIKEEIKRTIPVIKALVKKIKVPISIDTYKSEVAKQALDNGAVLVNDISGLRDYKMAKLIAGYKAGVVIMHMKGNPRTMQKKPLYQSLMDEIAVYLGNAINKAVDAGIAKDRIIIDPGIGFGKTLEHNLEILRNLKELKVLGQPLLVGPSRKSFIGKILKNNPEDRLCGTIASCVSAVENGANIIRAHDIKAIKEALKITGAINKA